MALAPGVKLGPYEIVAPIGAGGLGEMYRAIDRKLNRPGVEAAYVKSGFRAACLKPVQLREQAYASSPTPGGTGGYPVMIPLQYACLRDKPKVLEWLDRLLCNKGYGTPMLLKTAPELDFMRSDPAFHDLLVRIGLPP